MKMKKVIALLLSMTMVAGMSVSSFADEKLTIGSSNEQEVREGLFIASNSVPTGAEEFAIKMFESLTPQDMDILEMGNDIEAVRLGYAFTVDGTEIPQYYFPILENDTVIGIMIVSDYGNRYGFQLGVTNLSENINKLKTDSQNPAEIIVSENAYYGKDKDSIQILKKNPEASEQVIEEEVQELSNEITPLGEKEIVGVSSENVFDTKINTVETYKLMGKKHDVACVNNMSYEENNETHGSCWASCVGSLVDFYIDGKKTPGEGARYRKQAFDEQKASTGSHAASNTEATKYINKYSGSNLSYRKEDPVWSTIKSTLLNKTIPAGSKGSPFYSYWLELSEKSAHAMVVSGYRYENAKPNDESYYCIYLMDPNESTIQLLQYRDNYTIGKSLYTWEGSAR